MERLCDIEWDLDEAEIYLNEFATEAEQNEYHQLKQQLDRELFEDMISVRMRSNYLVQKVYEILRRSPE